MLLQLAFLSARPEFLMRLAIVDIVDAHPRGDGDLPAVPFPFRPGKLPSAGDAPFGGCVAGGQVELDGQLHIEGAVAAVEMLGRPDHLEGAVRIADGSVQINIGQSRTPARHPLPPRTP